MSHPQYFTFANYTLQCVITGQHQELTAAQIAAEKKIYTKKKKVKL